MSKDKEAQYVRDLDELEGCLLPSAEAVLVEDTGLPEATASIATAQANRLVAPSLAPLGHDPQLDKMLLAIAHHKGKMKSELEQAVIRAGNQEVFSKNYFQKEEIRLGNKRAGELNLLEEGWVRQLSDHVVEPSPLPAKAAPVPAPAPAPPQNSYGGEYQVSDYETGAYDTSDYEVQEYKSVYEG
jgi:hypothetical protein